MKRFAPIPTILVGIFLSSPPFVAAASFTIATNQFEIAFEDESVSAANRNRIEMMLAAVLPAWTNAPVEFDLNGTGGTIWFERLGLCPFQHRVDFPNEFTSGPTNETLILHVPESFSDASILSFNWCDRHSTEFSSGLDFARMLATNGIPENGIEQYFFSPGIPSTTLAAATNSLRSILSGKTFSIPVELSFAELNEDPDVPEGTPMMLLPFHQTPGSNGAGTGEFLNNVMPAILMNGRWRIYLWKP